MTGLRRRLNLRQKLILFSMASSMLALLLAGGGVIYYDQVLVRRDVTHDLLAVSQMPFVWLRDKRALPHFKGGHMFYTWDESRRAFRDAMKGFYRQAAGRT